MAINVNQYYASTASMAAFSKAHGLDTIPSWHFVTGPIPALKKARRRMRGGILGIGDSNTNNCLKKDAEAAILALGGDLK